MNVNSIFNILTENAREILPELEGRNIEMSDSLVELGANSMDRSEILMMTLEAISLVVPLVQMANAKNIGELAVLMHEKLQQN